jgi:uncharacterized protein (TIGR02466 family)
MTSPPTATETGSPILMSHTQNLWGTPFLRRSTGATPAYNAELVTFVRAVQEEGHGTTAGVFDAEKSRSDLLRYDAPVIEVLREWIVTAASQMNQLTGTGHDSHGEPVGMIAEAWAVTYHEWGYHTMHAHHDSAWSGVYYASVGDTPELAGTVEFLDPRPAAAARQPGSSPLYSVCPEPGLLIAFPSWLQHWVTPHGDSSDRICVAFNVGFERGLR